MCFVSVLAHLRVKMYQGITYQKHNGNIGEQSLVYYYITGHPCSPIQHVGVLNKMNVSKSSHACASRLVFHQNYGWKGVLVQQQVLLRI